MMEVSMSESPKVGAMAESFIRQRHLEMPLLILIPHNQRSRSQFKLQLQLLPDPNSTPSPPHEIFMVRPLRLSWRAAVALLR